MHLCARNLAFRYRRPCLRGHSCLMIADAGSMTLMHVLKVLQEPFFFQSAWLAYGSLLLFVWKRRNLRPVEGPRRRSIEEETQLEP